MSAYTVGLLVGLVVGISFLPVERMATRRLKRKQRKQRKRKQTRRYRGGDYRRATTQSMQSVALPRDAGVSIVGRSGIFSVQEAEEYKAKVMDGMRP